MRKLRKSIMGIAVTVTMLFGVALNVQAQTITAIWESPFNLAGDWWSGFDEDEIISLTGTYSSVCGGNVGINFYNAAVGLPNGFKRDLNRKGYIELKEDDTGNNANEMARKYTGYFGYDLTGKYCMTTFSNTYTNSECIESNRVVELYMRIMIATNSSDTTNTVPEGLFQYEMWVD